VKEENKKDIVRELSEWKKRGEVENAKRIIRGIQNFGDNLQKVVDFAEFGEVT